MTAPDSKLVEAVARAIYIKRNGKWDYNAWRSDPRIAEAYRGDAKAAIAACYAEEMRGVLQRIGKALAEQPVLILTGDLLEALEAGRDVLTKLEGQP